MFSRKDVREEGIAEAKKLDSDLDALARSSVSEGGGEEESLLDR
jgi:hypothetical protein